MHIVHIQCLVESSILAGVFLTSSFCVVPESSYSSNAAISSLLVAWSLNCSIAASSTESMVASFKNVHTKGGGCRNWRLFSSRSLHVDYYWVHRKTLCSVRPHRAHIHVVLSRKTPLQQQFYYQFDTTALGSMGFISLCAKPHKTHVLCTWVL